MAVLFLKLQTWNSNSFVLFDLYSGAGRGSRMHFMRLLLALTSPFLLAWCASLLWMILDGHKLRPKFLLIFGAHRCTKSKVHNCRKVEQKIIFNSCFFFLDSLLECFLIEIKSSLVKSIGKKITQNCSKWFWMGRNCDLNFS